MAQEKRQINNGPGKYDLQASLFHGGSLDDRVLVSFRLDAKPAWASGTAGFVAVLIDSASRDNSSGAGWNLGGYVFLTSGKLGKRYTARYNLETRKGVITFL